MVGIVIKSNTKCHQEEHKDQYYVEMPHSPPTNNVEHEEHVVNLDYPTPTLNTWNTTKPDSGGDELPQPPFIAPFTYKIDDKVRTSNRLLAITCCNIH